MLHHELAYVLSIWGQNWTILYGITHAEEERFDRNAEVLFPILMSSNDSLH